MKKTIILFTILLSVNYIFTQDIPSKITEVLRESGLYAFSAEAAEKEQKPFVDISSISIEDFMRFTITPWTRKDLFPNEKNITYQDIIKTFKEGVNIYSLPSWSYENYSWRRGKSIEYSVIYSINTYYPITGPGHYSIKIFDSDYVYIIGLNENRVIDEPNKEYDKLNDIFSYKQGQKMDKSRGLEQTQGYYTTEKKAARFYEKLRRKDSDLPKTALRLQEAEEFIEKVLDNY